MAYLNSSVVECLLSIQEVRGSILGHVYFLFAYCHMLQLQHLLSAAYDALINTFFSLVNKRLCSPGLKHCTFNQSFCARWAVASVCLYTCIYTGLSRQGSQVSVKWISNTGGNYGRDCWGYYCLPWWTFLRHKHD